jgi:hypothetical protein
MKEVSEEFKNYLLNYLYSKKSEEDKPFLIVENDKMFSMHFKKINKKNKYKYGNEIHTSHSYTKNDIIKMLFKDKFL